MKKALNFIATYFLFLALGLIFGTILYSFYLNVSDYIIGSEISFFSIKEITKAFIHVAYCMCFLIIPALCFYRVRHICGFPQLLAFIFTCLFTWFLLFPGVCYLNDTYENNYEFEDENTHLSKGYFRQSGDKVYFFTKDFKYSYGQGYLSNGVIIDMSENGKVTYEEVLDDYRLELNKSAAPYREMQVRNTFEDKEISIPIDFNVLISAARTSFEEGFIQYLIYLSFVLLMGMLFGASNFFEWRLLNTTLIFFITSIIFTVNTFYYSSGFINIRNRIENKVFFEWISSFTKAPLLLVLNVFFTLIFAVILIVKAVIKSQKKKNR